MARDKINDLMHDMRRDLMIIGLKSTGIMFLSIPFLVMVEVGLGVEQTPAPLVLAIFTCLMIHFNFTAPRTKLVGEKYKKLVTEELERRASEGKEG